MFEKHRISRQWAALADCIRASLILPVLGQKTVVCQAQGKPFQNIPEDHTLPGGFEEGKNYKTYTSPAECEEQLRQLLADPAAILAMAQHNAAYYQTWLRPEQQVRQALRQLEAGKM